jgi:hypothetical protein
MRAGGMGGGGMFGSDSASISAIEKYVNAHGGGTIAVSSQTGASASIISSGANVAGIGGFSGRESQVSLQWLAQAVSSGKIRWVLTDSSGGAGFGQDGRVGSSQLMTVVAQTCKKVTVPGSTSGTLYDCSGQAAALLAAAN